MRYTTTIILLCAAAGLGAYVYFVERHSRTTDQVEADRAKLAPGFDRTAVTRVVISRPGQPEVTLEREKAADWKLTTPRPARADGGALAEVLSAVEFLEFRAKVGDPGARSRAEYGLQPPKATIRLRAGAKELVFSVGSDDATGQGVYAARGDEPTVYVVEKRFRDLLDRDPDVLRDRRLMAFEAAKVKQLRVGEAVLEKTGDAWFVTTPQKMRAADAKVQDLLRSLESIRATRFVADTTATGKVLSVTDDSPHTVTVGGECPGAAGEVLAVRGVPEAASLCVSKADAERVALLPEALRDSRLLTVRPEDARKVTIDAQGRQLVLAREGTVWKVTAPAGAPADDDVVRKWLEDLGSYRALAVQPGDAAAHGIGGKDTLRVTVEQDGGRTATVAIGPTRDGRRWAHRGDDAVLLQVHGEAGDAISADPLFFRSRKVLQVPRWEVKSIGMTVGGTTETAERGAQEQWKLEKPLALDADAGVIDRLLSAVADLRAEKLLPGSAFAPTYTLRLVTQPTEAAAAGDGGVARKPMTHVLEIGGDAPGGGCLARSAGTVMTLAKGPCEDLRVHLATRKLVDLGEQAVIGITLARGGKREALEKRGPTWHKSAGPRVPTEQIDDLLGTLRALSARAVVQYGPDAGHGLAKPRLEASLKLDGGKEVKLAFGAESERGVYARLEGRDVTYLVAQRDVEALEKAAP